MSHSRLICWGKLSTTIGSRMVGEESAEEPSACDAVNDDDSDSWQAEEPIIMVNGWQHQAYKEVTASGGRSCVAV